MLTITAPFLNIGPAIAGLSVSPVPDFPTTVTVGEGFTGSVSLFNTSTPPESADPITLTGITLVPSCAEAVNTANCSTGIEPGVFAIPLGPAAATGSGGCAGTTFAVTQPSSGLYLFTPNMPVILPAGGNCVISFGTALNPVRTLRVPTTDVFPGTILPGDPTGMQVQTRTVATVTGSNIFGPVTGQFGIDVVTVLKGQPTIVTNAVQVGTPPAPDTPVSTVAIGTSIRDAATVTGVANGPAPTGPVNFQLVTDPAGTAPGTCVNAPAALGSGLLATVAPATTPPSAVATSPSVTAASGTYHFIATYAGDANYLPSRTTACGEANENVTTQLRMATLTTQASLPAGAPVTAVPPNSVVFDNASVVANDPGLLAGQTRWRLDRLPVEVDVALGSGSGRITAELRAATCDDRVCRLRRTQRAYDVILTDC